MKFFLITVLALFLVQSPITAQGWVKTYYDYQATGLNEFSEKTLDNGYIMVGHFGSSDRDIHVKKTDAFGNVQWTYTLTKVGFDQAISIKQIPSDGGYIILYFDGAWTPNLIRLDALGQEVYEMSVNLGMKAYTGSSKSEMILTSDEHILITSGTTDTVNNSSPTLGLAKLDLSGNVFWSKLYTHANTYQTRPMTLTEATDGSYLIVGTIDTFIQFSGNGTDLYMIKTDTAGNDLWRKTEVIPSSVSPSSIFHTSDGGYLVTGSKSVTGFLGRRMFAVKLDANADPMWDWDMGVSSTYGVGAHGAVENADGTFTITGASNYGAPLYKQIALVKLSATGNLLFDIPLSIGSAAAVGKQIYTTNIGGYSIFGTDGQGCFLITVDSVGVLYTNHIVGNYYHDLNGNCVQDIGEPMIVQRTVTAEKSTESRFGVTDMNGAYSIEVDTGTYTVSVDDLSPYWQFCQNPQTVTFNNFYSQDTVNIAVQVLDTCSYMEVEISAPFLRRCFPAVYNVRYDNWGTADATNSYVEVTLDNYLVFDSSTIPLISQIGNIYRFDLGTIPMATGGQFQIHVTVDCDSTVLGQVHCVEAHIYPDTICIPNHWGGPVIHTSSNCSNDSVTFRISNVGTDMTGPKDYSIIEEHVMIQMAPFTLLNGQDHFVTVPALPGATYRIEAQQADGFPPLLGDSISIDNHIGCNSPPTINFPGLVNQFYNGNISPYISVDCQPNIGAFDPNDKQAQPVGYGAQHYITNNIPLNYHIRFQNTGTDTAFTVVVVDTIDANLDASSINMGASSHDYTWTLREGGILIVTFDNIMLPDSNVNYALSNGFFKFSINQKANNPVGTMIYNQAGIYFDFNPPVMTNQTFHTIGQDFVTVILTGIEDVTKEHLSVNVFPNPFENYTTIEIEGEAFGETTLEILDMTGRSIRQLQVSGNRIRLDRGNLIPGMYIYRLSGDKEVLNTGKLIVR